MVNDIQTINRVTEWLRNNGYGNWIVLRGMTVEKMMSVNYSGSPERRETLRRTLDCLIA